MLDNLRDGSVFSVNAIEAPDSGGEKKEVVRELITKDVRKHKILKIVTSEEGTPFTLLYLPAVNHVFSLKKYGLLKKYRNLQNIYYNNFKNQKNIKIISINIGHTAQYMIV